MRVLWLSVTPGMYDEKKTFGWIAALEDVVHKYLGDKVDLALAFEDDGEKFDRVEKNHTVYYMLPKKYSFIDSIKRKVSAKTYWKHLKKYITKVIRDFRPDIIHCFGSEWPIGNVAECTDVPVVVHIQGVLNVVNYCEEMAIGLHERIRLNRFRPDKIAKSLVHNRFKISSAADERHIFKINKYFMGRTDWDRRIVKYFSPGSTYFHVPEAIRPDIYNSDKHWSWHSNKKLRLLTVSQATYIKGNGIILQTAEILKKICGMDVEWHVTGRLDTFQMFENKTGIHMKDVGVKHIGMIDAQQVVDELLEADFYVHPSIIDNSPNSLCEAQLIGCPVIAANVGGIPQLVEEGKNGFLYPHNEPHTLAFKICELTKKKSLLEKISVNEIEVAHDRHNPQKVSEILYSTYLKICSQ